MDNNEVNNGNIQDGCMDEKEEREMILESLKLDINNFLWEKLSSKTTIGEAEDIAIKIYEQILRTWD